MQSTSFGRWLAGGIFALLCASLAFSASPARADIGLPPLNPAGAGLGLGEGVETQVRMLSETVDLTIEEHARPQDAMGESPGDWMRGRVEAEFQMRNLGTVEETLDVWFPLAASLRYPGALAYFPDRLIQDFKVWGDGQPLETEQVTGPDLIEPSQTSQWAHFPITFPAGQDVSVRLSYTVYPTGRRPFGGFEYILQTGAGWKDTIGVATITIYLPHEITPENLSQSGNSIEGHPLAPNPPGYVIEGNLIRWQLTDLEPSAEDNIYVDVLEPQRYRDLLQARLQAENSPSSVAAQLELAQASENALSLVKLVGNHGGGKLLAEQVNLAYRRALELDPQQAETYGLYASWQMRSGGWVKLMRGEGCPAELCELVQRGLERFPDDPELLRIDEEIRMLQEEFEPFHTQTAIAMTPPLPEPVPPTQTAVAHPPIETPLPSATRTQPPATLAPSPTDTPAPTAQPAGGLCPAGLLPLGFGLLILLIFGLRRA
jgi:hypothetical protein